MNIKKKLIAVAAVLAVFASFTGCKDKNGSEDAKNGSSVAANADANNSNAAVDVNNNGTLSQQEIDQISKHDLTIEPFVPGENDVQQDPVEPQGGENSTVGDNSTGDSTASNESPNNAYPVEDDDPGNNNVDLPSKTGLKVHNGTRTTMQAWWMDISKQQDYIFNGEYLVAEFKIKENTADGIYPITLDWLDFANFDAKTINFTAIDGAIVVGGEAEENKFNEGSSDPQIMVSNVSGKAGETVKVAIQIKDNPGVVANILRFSYNSDVLEFVSAGEGADFNGHFS